VYRSGRAPEVRKFNSAVAGERASPGGRGRAGNGRRARGGNRRTTTTSPRGVANSGRDVPRPLANEICALHVRARIAKAGTSTTHPIVPTMFVREARVAGPVATRRAPAGACSGERQCRHGVVVRQGCPGPNVKASCEARGTP